MSSLSLDIFSLSIRAIGGSKRLVEKKSNFE
jgi:hypothetical protein